MCGDAGCFGNCTSFAGQLFQATEKVMSYTALTSVICCIVFLMAVTLSIGIGVGFNYCTLQIKGAVPGDAEVTDELLRSNNNEEVSYRLGRRMMNDSLAAPAPVMPKDQPYALNIPLHSNMDFDSFLGKLRRHNKNATVNLIA